MGSKLSINGYVYYKVLKGEKEVEDGVDGEDEEEETRRRMRMIIIGLIMISMIDDNDKMIT